MTEKWTTGQIQAFERDGSSSSRRGSSTTSVELLRERFDKLFEGDYETGIRPDKVNWVSGRDPDDRTRQICNGWKADPWIAAQVLSERTGRLAAELIAWDGVRLLQTTASGSPPRQSLSGCTRTEATSTTSFPRR